MNRDQLMILVILILSTLLPRFAPFWFYQRFEKAVWWKSMTWMMPSLLLGLLVMISLPDAFFTSFQWIEWLGLLFMVLVHIRVKKPMMTLVSGSLLVVILKTFI